MDQRLQGRIDPHDVIQEAYLEATRLRADYLAGRSRRFICGWRNRGKQVARAAPAPLGTRMRDASRDVSIYRGTMPEATSAALAARLLGQATRPSEAAARAEAKGLLLAALNAMAPIDWEVLALRHFEQLTPAQAASVLGISEKAAGMRYLRAIKRLKGILAATGMMRP